MLLLIKTCYTFVFMWIRTTSTFKFKYPCERLLKQVSLIAFQNSEATIIHQTLIIKCSIPDYFILKSNIKRIWRSNSNWLMANT